ncbi:HAD family hydrolase [Frisingicoccus sp.]|uniref:HAD family hydrolase n=1 Tax=Frisingicoccus sp. TaxID=1918627 RepID=UPI002EAA85CA|nr:HAD family hydrolase [Frisingicoccus sp.]
MKDIQTIIFDYDGTLHNSTRIYADAFRTVYKQMVLAGDAPEREFTDEEITKWLGYSACDMWQAFMPELSIRKQVEYSKDIGQIMTWKIKNKQAVLYDGALETLQYLKNKGYHLLYLSNCGHEFMRMHAECFELDQYFEHMYCSGDYENRPKYEIFDVIKEDYPEAYMMVGDRFHDMEVARKHHIYSAGCAYGFGSRQEIEDADIILEDIRDLQKFL